MWFDEIMDDCKQALITAKKYKDVFVPVFLKLALTIAVFAYIAISLVAGIIVHQDILDYAFTDYYAFLELIPAIIGNLVIIYLLVLTGFSLLDVGSINMFKAALNGQKPRFRDFIDGIKNYFFKVLLGKLFMHLLIIVTLPITAFLFILYALLVGTLTAGWGMLFLGVFISIYFGTWLTITVIEGCSPITAIGKSIKLGRRYFKGLFIVLLASTMISSYSVVIFGPLVAVLAGWFITGVLTTCFQLVIMLIYYRNKEFL